MSGHGEKLARKQEAAIGALLSERTIGEAAVKAGISERTLKGWLAQPAFASEYRLARQALLDRTVSRLLAVCGEAVDTLQQGLTAGKPGDRIRAAVAVLTLTAKGVETLDLAERISALEAAQAERERAAG